MKTLNSLVALMVVMVCTLSATNLQAEEIQHPDGTALSSTTLSGYVDTSAIWNTGMGVQLFSIPVSNPVGTFPGTYVPWYPTNRPTHFVAMLSWNTSTNVFFAGTADFVIGSNNLQFNIDVPAIFSNIVGARMSTPSRQVTVDLGAASFQTVSTNSFWPLFYSFDGIWHYSGSIPLNDTLHAALQNGQGQVEMLLTHNYWGFSQGSLWGNLLGLPDTSSAQPADCWPRNPRSISARYTRASSERFPQLYQDNFLDLDRDSLPDYSFTGNMVCTASIPPFCTTTFGIVCLSSNELLLKNLSSVVLEIGSVIGPQPPTNAVWDVSSGASVNSIGFGVTAYNLWYGPLGFIGEGYLGTRMPKSDGWHYGWIRVRLPGPAEEGLLIVEDWAFEPQANTPILAGAKPFEVAAQSLGIVRPGYLRIQIPTEPGRSYIVQRKPTLSTLDWENASYIFIATSQEIQIDLPIADAMGFYRNLEAD